MTEVLKKFGRYFLLDQMAVGGMAEIFRAREMTPDGLGRLLVVKRIQPSYGSNDEFVAMFRSEIKVMMNLTHPNIVQLMSYGEEQGQPFIAMEYVEGRSLRQLRDRYVDKSGGLPPELAAHLVAQAAAGLHYAHSYKDRVTGKPLNLVHRDVSPQNILVSYEGNVKVIDFGIAKASVNSEQTRAGVIKGKIGYLSPDQINNGGLPLDGRSDLFSLGIVLWELLAGRKLFTGENEIAILRMIESCSTSIRKPSHHNPAVPPELDYIVMKALAKNRDHRFADCLEFQKHLQRFLVQNYPEFNGIDIGSQIKSNFSDDIVKEQKEIQRLNERAQHLLSLDRTPRSVSMPSSAGENTDSSLDAASSGSRNFDSTQMDVRASSSVKVEVPVEPVRTVSRPQTRSSSGSRPTGGTQRSSSSSRPGAPPRAVQANSGGGFFKLAAMAGAAAAVVFALYGNPSSDSGRVPAGQATGQAQAPAVQQEQIALLLQLNPVGGMARISVNGKSIGENGGAMLVPAEGPLVVKVPPTSSYDITIEANGFKPLRAQGAIDLATLSVGIHGREFKIPLSLEPEVFGLLKYRSPIANASLRVEVGGQNWLYKSSLTGGTEVVRLPPGTYRLEFFSSSLNLSQVIQGVQIEAGGTVEQDVTLRQ